MFMAITRPVGHLLQPLFLVDATSLRASRILIDRPPPGRPLMDYKQKQETAVTRNRKFFGFHPPGEGISHALNQRLGFTKLHRRTGIA